MKKILFIIILATIVVKTNAQTPQVKSKTPANKVDTSKPGRMPVIKPNANSTMPVIKPRINSPMPVAKPTGDTIMTKKKVVPKR